MAYKKQYFKNGNVLTAEQLNHMEDGIVEAEKSGGSGGTGGASFAQTYTDMTPGYVSAKNGTFGTGGNWQRTDYIPVSSGDVVTFSGRIGDSMGVAGYDENKAFVASVLDRINLEGGYTYENEPLTIPDGVAYIAGCTISGAYPITVMVYKDAKALVEAGGTGLPSDVGAYKYMATDGEGNWVAVDRLAWKEGEKVEITWDGNTEGKTVVADSLCKVSSLVLTRDQIFNSEIIQPDGKSYYLKDEIGYMFFGDGVASYNGQLWFVDRDNVTYTDDFGTVVFNEGGVYVAYFPNGTYAASRIIVPEAIHPIPAEYLPQPIVFTTSDDMTTVTSSVYVATINAMSDEEFYNTDFELSSPSSSSSSGLGHMKTKAVSRIKITDGFACCFMSISPAEDGVVIYKVLYRNGELSLQYSAMN